MKKFLFSFLILLFLKIGIAQNWCPQGAMWHYRKYETQYGYRYNGFLELKFTNTVTVLGKTCQQITSTFVGQYENLWAGINMTYTVIPNLYNYYTYENNGMVFIYSAHRNNFDTLANFRAKIGDSWMSSGLDMPDCPHKRPKFTVTDSVFIFYNGIKLRLLNNSFLERVGGMSGFLFIENTCPELDVFGKGGDKFYCYRDDNFPEYVGDGITNCFSNVVSISENNFENNSIKFFPNPSNGNFKVEIDQALQLSIYNAFGELIFSNSYSNSGTFDLQFPNLPKGIYFAKTQSKTKNEVLKFVVE